MIYLNYVKNCLYISLACLASWQAQKFILHSFINWRFSQEFMVMPGSKGKKNSRSKKNKNQTFEEYSEGKDFSKKGSGRSRKKSYGGRDSGRGDSDRRDSRRGSSDRRGPRRGSSDRRDSSKIERTTVTCDECKEKCEVPFKPTSNKPSFCDDCFKKNKDSKENESRKELEAINEKLDKIMKSLKI